MQTEPAPDHWTPHGDEAIRQMMEQISQGIQREIRLALAIPPEPSPLPAPDNPLYGFLREQHRFIARLRGRPCRCDSCDD